MTKAKITNLCFQVMAAFWAVIVIAKTQTAVRWHAYALAVVGVIVISAVGTRLKHRMQKREKPNSAAVAAAPPS